MRHSCLYTFLGIFAFICGCTVEHAEEQILATHSNGLKKTSIWVYPDGTVLKRNEWYNDGIKEFEIPYKNNVPHGTFKRWTGFGDIALIGEYKNGKREGTWTSYYTDKLNTRKKEAERYYEDDHAIGDWIGWHFNGTKAFEEHYNEKGDTIGVWKKWDENGTLIEENSCFETNKKGYFKKFARNCKILEYHECYFGQRVGDYRLYYETFGAPDTTGKTCNTAKIKEEGVSEECGGQNPQVFYRADGSVIKKIEYIDKDDCGFTPSRVSWLDEHGNLLRETIFKNHTYNFGYDGVTYGLCEGLANLFCAETSYVQYGNPYGTLDSSTLSMKDAFKQSIGRYKANVRYIKPNHKLLYEEFWDMDSTSKYKGPVLLVSRSFYPDSMGGKMASEGFWKTDSDGKSKRNGILRNWYPSGIIRDSLSYVNGERVGEQFSYDSTGRLTIHKTENGRNHPVIMHLKN